MTNPNDPAMPTGKIYWTSSGDHYHGIIASGVSKREYFAAMAMQGLILHREEELDYSAKLPPYVIAKMAIAQADALIAKLNKDEKK